jgi:hypothetical protein
MSGASDGSPPRPHLKKPVLSAVRSMAAPPGDGGLKPYKLVHGKKNSNFAVVNKDKQEFTKSQIRHYKKQMKNQQIYE